MTDQIPTPRDVSQAIDDSVTRKLKSAWGGRFPTWEEYKVAKEGGRVKANKNIGIKAIHLRGVPRGLWFLFGIVTPWGMFAAPVVCIILAMLGVWGWWTIILGLFVSWFLYKVSLEGAADAIKYGAEENEALYQALVCRGAFLFGPAESVPAQPNAELLGALGELMEQYPTALLDTARLPACKQKMKDVIKEVWREQPKLRGTLTQAYLHLSQFQDGIGDAVLDCKVVEAGGAAAGSHDVETLQREAVAASGTENFRNWIAWSKVSMAEMEILTEEWDKFERSKSHINLKKQC
jgi:hypothetical protein